MSETRSRAAGSGATTTTHVVAALLVVALGLLVGCASPAPPAGLPAGAGDVFPAPIEYLSAIVCPTATR
jgi:hypothetical protein